MGKSWMVSAFRDAGDTDHTDAGAALASPRGPKLPLARSPRSPFSILKNTLRLSRSSCGVCMQTLKSGHGMAIYTAECSHGFHFSCVVSHVRERGSLVCPVCGVTWKDAPFLAVRPHNEAALMEIPKKNRKNSQLHFVENSRYADDEPLLTPKSSRALLAPIQDEEFPGFLNNPVSSTDYRLPGDPLKLEFSLSSEAAVISRGPIHNTYAVVLKVKSPALQPKRAAEKKSRAPIDLVAVLDVSEGMAGAKLAMLKRSMLLVLSSLSSADRLCIVAFSSAPRRLMPLTRMTARGQRLAEHIIHNLSCSQGASVEEALKHATQVLHERHETNPVASVILLSGGHGGGFAATKKYQRSQEDASFTRFAHVEIPVNYPEPAENTVSRCLGGLLCVVVKDLRVQLSFGPGSDPGEITAVYPLTQPRTVFGPNCIRLGDMYSEEEKALMVEIRVPASLPRVGLHHVIAVNHYYKDPITRKPIKGGDRHLVFPRAETVRSGGLKIERLWNTFISHRAVAESFRLIERGAMDKAEELLSSALALLRQSAAHPADEWVENLEAQLKRVKSQRRRVGD